MSAVRRGRKNPLNELVDQLVRKVGEQIKKICFISHGDCEEDAHYVKEIIHERLGVEEFLIAPGGPVIGAHAGPGAVAVFMVA